MSKQFIAIIAACLVIFGGLLFFNKDKNASTAVTAEPSNHLFGVQADNPDATGGVTLVEYGDFQCPACGAYYPIVEQLKEKYADKITFQYRNFPLVALHPNAMAAHKAAEAASRQGKFWEMYKLLYEQQKSWESSQNPGATFEAYAGQLGLDMDKYRTDVSSEDVNATIQADISAGKELNIQGTPGFVLDGKVIDNPKTVDAFDQLIQDAIKENSTS